MKAALSSAVSLTHKDIDVAAVHFQAPSLFWGCGGVGSNRDAVTLWQLFPLSIYTGWRICCLKTRWKKKYYKYCKLILLTEDNLKVTEECKRRRQQLKLELTSQSLANVIRCKISHIFSYYFFYFSFSSLNMSSV